MPRIPSLHLAYACRCIVARRPLYINARGQIKTVKLKINENCKESLTQIGVLQLKERSRAIFMCVGKRDAHLRQPRFTLFRTRVFHAAHVSTNIPRKPRGMKSFAPFWPSRRRDERFVELTRKIFPSYRGTLAMKNIERHSAIQVVALWKITPPIVGRILFNRNVYEIVITFTDNVQIRFKSIESYQDFVSPLLKKIILKTEGGGIFFLQSSVCLMLFKVYLGDLNIKTFFAI